MVSKKTMEEKEELIRQIQQDKADMVDLCNNLIKTINQDIPNDLSQFPLKTLKILQVSIQDVLENQVGSMGFIQN